MSKRAGKQVGSIVERQGKVERQAGKQGIDAAMHASKQTWYKASKQWGSNAESQPLVDF